MGTVDADIPFRVPLLQPWGLSVKKCRQVFEGTCISIVSLVMKACGGDEIRSGRMDDDDPVDLLPGGLPQALIEVGRYNSSNDLNTDRAPA